MKKILVADDEENILSTLRDILSFEGYEVITARDGEGVLHHLKSVTPDLFVLDINMPEPDGASLSTDLRMKPAYRDIPIIFVSGMIAKDLENNQWEGRGNTVYLSKPFEVEDLLAAVKKALKEQ